MSIERPWHLLALLLVALAAAAYVLFLRRPVRYRVHYTNVDVLAVAAGRRRTLRRHLTAGLLGLALCVLAVATARPQLTRTVAVERATVILVIDRSRSMESQDVRPSRLVAAKAAAAAFLDRVPANLRVGLVSFSGDVTVAASPTLDRVRLHRSIRGIGTGSGYGGTAIGDALARAVELARDSLAERRPASTGGAPPPTSLEDAVSILFLSDGRQNRGLLPPAEGARLAEEAGIPVYTVALGTANVAGPPQSPGQAGNPFGGGGRYRAPDPATLRMIARRTGGAFYEARSRPDVTAAYEELGSRLGRAKRTSEVTFAFVGVAAVLLAAAAAGSPFLWPRLP